MNATIGDMRNRRKLGPFARRELLFDIVEVWTITCCLLALGVGVLIKLKEWGWV